MQTQTQTPLEKHSNLLSDAEKAILYTTVRKLFKMARETAKQKELKIDLCGPTNKWIECVDVCFDERGDLEVLFYFNLGDDTCGKLALIALGNGGAKRDEEKTDTANID